MHAYPDRKLQHWAVSRKPDCIHTGGKSRKPLAKVGGKAQRILVDPQPCSYAAGVKRLLPALLILSCVACASNETGPAAVVPAVPDWHNAATSSDRERLRGWRTAWTRALDAARAAGHGAALAAEGTLLDPDAALAGPTPTAGEYRCRTIKIGAKSPGLLDYVAYPQFACRIAPGEGTLDFAKLSGSQRPLGRLFTDSSRRMILLGTLQLGDEQGVLRYGRDQDRDMIALLERIGERRWRLVFPYPHFESLVDVIELVPAS
jgi:hypothetical protein